MITDIVKKTGVAKGTFYYYFPTKEAILEAICTRWATELATCFELESRHLSALQKLQSFISHQFAPNQLDRLSAKLWDDKEFDLLYKMWQSQIEKVFNPLLIRIIEHGNEDESMHVLHLKETIDFFWSTLNCLWEAFYFKEPFEVFSNKVKIAVIVLERILGIHEGTLEISIDKR